MSEKVPAKKKKKAPEEPKIKAKTKASSDSVVGLESKEPPSEKPKKKEKKVKPRSTSITGTTATREEAPKKKGSAKKARSSSVTGGGVQKATKAVAPKVSSPPRSKHDYLQVPCYFVSHRRCADTVYHNATRRIS